IYITFLTCRSSQINDIDESDIMSSDSISDNYENSTLDEVKYRPFAHLQPAKVEFTSIFPSYPKSHINGYATVVDLDKLITKAEDVTNLRNALQYSLTKGHGQRLKTVEF